MDKWQTGIMGSSGGFWKVCGPWRGRISYCELLVLLPEPPCVPETWGHVTQVPTQALAFLSHPDSSKTTRVTSTALPSHPPLQSLRVWCPLPTPLSLMTQGSVTCCNHGLVPSSCHGHTLARGTEFLRESLNPKTNQNMALGGHLRAAHCVPVLAHSSPPDTHPHAAR